MVFILRVKVIMMNKIDYETRTGKEWLRDDGISHYVYHSGVKITLEDAKEIGAKHLEAASGIRYPILVDMKNILGLDNDARKYFSANDFYLAVAMLIESPVSRVIANFFIGISKPPAPIKMFTSKEKAIEWLKRLINEAK